LFVSLESPEVDNHHTGASTFAIRTTCPALAGSQRTGQKSQKSFHHTDPKENINFFSNALKNKNATHSRDSMTTKLNTDNGLQGQ
jgi:hypothetical protein